MPLNREMCVNYKNDNPVNAVRVSRSENVTITLKTVVNMFSRKLPLIKTNKEIHPLLRRIAWEKRFLNEEKSDDKDEGKNILKEEIKELQGQCMAWQKKSKTNDDELLKLKHKINMLEEEREKLQNKLKEVESAFNEYEKRNSHFQEITNYQKEINAMANSPNNNLLKENIGILYWPINKYSKIKATRIGGHYTVFSKEFSLGENGYMFSLEANLNGDVKFSWGTHLFIQLYLVTGPNDKKLYWPCNLMGMIGILDASGKNQNYLKTFSCCIQQPGNKEVISFPEFIHQSDLTKSYLVNDTLTLFVMLYDMKYFFLKGILNLYNNL
ncbi:TNF receptor-associated factor 2-like [Centruroides vittatus]|uniref:TNF receptor-associated factor 2-like n=1 Tax=Centruroides vittatus TaxID=120091 RepID=UPI00350FAA4E